MAEFHYQELLPLGQDDTKYRKLTGDHVSVGTYKGKEILEVAPEGLTLLAREAMRDIAHLLRTAHLEQLASILKDPEASDNDRFVALDLLKNAVIAAEGVLPSCQDTGTAVVFAKKGQQVWSEGSDEEALSRGIFETYTETNLRYSQVSPLGMFEEKNTGTNLPAQIDILATGGDEYKFLFLAKGGGSANKTYLYQETKALLTPEALERFVAEKLKSIGTSACPPYHLALVVGGTSAETVLKVTKLASTKYLDHLPTTGNEHGRAFRDLETEALVLKLAQQTGVGAQFGGKYFAHDVRVIRMPRHGASCPVGLGVSCSADRNIKAKITRDGIFLEELDRSPARFLPGPSGTADQDDAVRIDLNRPMTEIRAALTRLEVGTRVMLTGPLVVARDMAHAKLKERLDRGEGLPASFLNHPVYYAGPAKTPEGYASGSFGPTTAGRMDSYVDLFQKSGGSLVMLAKGNRSQQVTDACKANGGFYLGSIGGPAARLAKDCIRKVEVLEYPELGMEAIWRIEVEDFPAFVIVDDKGNDFYARLQAASLGGVAIR